MAEPRRAHRTVNESSTPPADAPTTVEVTAPGGVWAKAKCCCSPTRPTRSGWEWCRVRRQTAAVGCQGEVDGSEEDQRGRARGGEEFADLLTWLQGVERHVKEGAAVHPPDRVTGLS